MYSAKNNKAIAAVSSDDSSILDVGCGTGATAGEIRNLFPKVTIVGVSNSEEELTLAKKHLDLAFKIDLNHFQADALKQNFDLIICSHVLEHLITPKDLLEQLSSRLTSRGRILILVPNFGHWTARWMALRGRFEYQDHGLMDRTHLRFFTWNSIKKELVPDNLVVLEHIKGGHLPLPGLRKLLPKKFVLYLDERALALCPNLFSTEIGLVLTKAEL